MKWAELLTITGDSPIFKTSQLLAGQTRPKDIRRQINRWRHSAKVEALCRGVYAIMPPFTKTQLHPFVAANAMVKGSYISLQSALAFYGIIPEYVPVTTSITPSRSFKTTNNLGTFYFTHLKSSMFFGYNNIEITPQQWAIVATKEKALIDLLYITPNSSSREYLNELRLSLSNLNLAILKKMAERLNSRKVTIAVNLLDKIYHQEEEFVNL